MRLNRILLLSILMITGCVGDRCPKCEISTAEKFYTASQGLPSVIKGLGTEPPLYDFSFIEGAQQKASYEKAFRSRLLNIYPPGSPEKNLIADLKQEGFVFDKENSSTVGYQGKKWTIYVYVNSVLTSVDTWLIAWRADSNGRIIELNCEAIPGTE